MRKSATGRSTYETTGLVLITLLRQPDTHTVPTLAQKIGEGEGRVRLALKGLTASGWTIERAGGPRGVLRVRWPG
ncbi:hypothetical protein, partial [Deinococcus phoenicis]|uniref:hypothetical protein n=1 Tax=Deinococcus phoenicis TaxID=1476583 RepID=UPI000555C274